MTVKRSELEFDIDHLHIYPYDNVYVMLGSMNPEFMNMIKGYFTIRMKNYKFTPAFKNGSWDGHIRFVKNGMLPKGLLHECAKALKELDIPS